MLAVLLLLTTLLSALIQTILGCMKAKTKQGGGRDVVRDRSESVSSPPARVSYPKKDPWGPGGTYDPYRATTPQSTEPTSSHNMSEWYLPRPADVSDDTTIDRDSAHPTRQTDSEYVVGSHAMQEDILKTAVHSPPLDKSDSGSGELQTEWPRESSKEWDLITIRPSNSTYTDTTSKENAAE